MKSFLILLFLMASLHAQEASLEIAEKNQSLENKIISSDDELPENGNNPLMMMRKNSPSLCERKNSVTSLEKQRNQKDISRTVATRDSFSDLRERPDQNRFSSQTTLSIQPEQKQTSEEKHALEEARKKTLIATIDLEKTKELLGKAQTLVNQVHCNSNPVYQEFLHKAAELVSQANANFHEAHEELHSLKQKALENNRMNLPQPRLMNSPITLKEHHLAEEEAILEVAQFLEANQWYCVKNGKNIPFTEASSLEATETTSKISSSENALVSEEVDIISPKLPSNQEEILEEETLSLLQDDQEQQKPSEIFSISASDKIPSSSVLSQEITKKKKKKKNASSSKKNESTPLEGESNLLDDLNIFELTNETLNVLLFDLFSNYQFSGYTKEKERYHRGEKIHFFSEPLDPYFKKGVSNLLNEKGNYFLPYILSLPEFEDFSFLKEKNSGKGFDFMPQEADSSKQQQFKRAIIIRVYDDIQNRIKAKEEEIRAAEKSLLEDEDLNSKANSKKKGTAKKKKFQCF